jgi:hypothetical protein
VSHLFAARRSAEGGDEREGGRAERSHAPEAACPESAVQCPDSSVTIAVVAPMATRWRSAHGDIMELLELRDLSGIRRCAGGSELRKAHP